jgi:hypothetical protein
MKTSEFLIYQAEDGKTQLSVVLGNDDLWLSQKHGERAHQTHF